MVSILRNHGIHAAMLLILLALTGCGKKGPVRPLEARLPNAPAEVTLSQRGSSLMLGWDIPRYNQDGSALTDLKRFDVYRIDYDPEDGCPECRNPKYLLQQIDVAYYQSSERSSRRIYMWDHFVEADTGYRYRIVPVTQKGQAGESATIHRPCFPSPAAPVNLTATSADRQITLEWQAPAQPLALDADKISKDGFSLAGYNIYRCPAGEYFGTRALNRAPVAQSAFEDLNLDNGKTYRYTVRTVVQYGGFMLESEAAAAVSAKPAAALE